MKHKYLKGKKVKGHQSWEYFCVGCGFKVMVSSLPKLVRPPALGTQGLVCSYCRDRARLFF